MPSGLKSKSLLADYNLIIDEVLDPFSPFQGVSPVDFQSDYLGFELVCISEDGLVVPTKAWDQRVAQNGKTFDQNMYHMAKSGSLYSLDNRLFITTIPSELLTKPKTVTVLTFLSEGSIFLHHIKS